MLLSYLSLALGLLLKLCTVYFGLIALFALKKSKPYPACEPQTKFAIVIAARNEEAVIGPLVHSLLQQEYPRSLFDVFVVPNNCRDRTADVALAAGAKVLTCLYPVTCKGGALEQAFDQLCSSTYDYDAFCVFDADNVVDSRFLAEMNRAFCAGARVAKGRNEAKNPFDSWISGCYATYFGLMNIFFNRARAGLGLSAKLVGTGFAVSRDYLRQTDGWHTETITEDADFAAQCAARGEKVAWVPRALTYDEEPNSFRLSVTQRRRWSSGIMQVARLRIRRLACPGSGHFFLRLDGIMVLLAPFIQGFSLFPLLLSLIFTLCFQPASAAGLLLSVLAGSALSYLGGMAGSVLISLLSGRSVRRMWKSILTFPFFLASWVAINIFSLFRKTTVWKEIHHCRNLMPEELPNLREVG